MISRRSFIGAAASVLPGSVAILQHHTIEYATPQSRREAFASAVIAVVDEFAIPGLCVAMYDCSSGELFAKLIGDSSDFELGEMDMAVIAVSREEYELVSRLRQEKESPPVIHWNQMNEETKRALIGCKIFPIFPKG